MRIVIFGGSFNPVHIGHLYIAEEIRTELKYDRVLFIPANIPAHKADRSGLAPDARLQMLITAVLNEKNYITDSCDIDRGGITFSIDTVRSIYDRYDFEGKPGFIIGDDLLDGFKTWKNSEKLIEMIDLIVVKRNISEGEENFSFPYLTVNNSVLPVSSTEIRDRVKNRKTIKYLVPDAVIKIIENNGYYR